MTSAYTQFDLFLLAASSMQQPRPVSADDFRPTSTTLICHESVGQKVAQQAVQHL